jgi:hypothetical protein
MSDFKRELLSVTSPIQMEGGAKSKKSAKKASKKASKGSKGSKKGSRKGSKKGSKTQKGGANPFMTKMLGVKKDLKAKYSSLKDGPAMSKLVSMHIKEDTVDKLLNMSESDIDNKLQKINKEIAEKRASKKAAKSA